jgi:Na+/proline symporter
MTFIDYTIIALYLAGMVFVGILFQRKASAGIDSYFLGNRKMSWWMLGASGMASNLDVSGTMINVALIYALGATGFFIEIRGGIVLIMAFLMIFMGKWNRRANVMTLAEWMELRFGNGFEGRLARLIAAIAILMSSTAIITYFAVGAGKFIGEFLGLPAMLGFPPEFWAAGLMIFLAMIYTVTSGLYGVVWTDVFQGFLIFTTIIIICFLSFKYAIPEVFNVSTPLKDGGFAPIATSREAWTNFFPQWNLNLPEGSAYSIYNLFGIAIIFYLIKTIIEGSGGTSGYMIQRFFASRSDRDTGLLSLFWIFLLAFRWPFIAAIAIMGIAFGASQGFAIEDPEMVLPTVIMEIVPIGVKGLLVAGLMAAAMSTFDSIVNSAASYWVKDIYQAFIKKDATEKQLINQSRISSVIMVAVGLFLTLNITSINDIWGWFNMGIGAGMIVPLLIRWYWWRLNGIGFASGIAAGMITAIIQRLVAPDIPEYASFALVCGLSLLGTIIGTYLSEPTAKDVLIKFYKKTRPFGFWKPVRSNIPADKLESVNKENKRDIISTIFAVPWQLTLFLTLMTIIMRRWDLLIILSGVLIFLSAGLYFFWFRHLSTETNIE